MEVVFFLLDGCRPDILRVADAPNIHMLMNKGTVAEKCYTVYPSLTAVGHMSILTGCYPEKTGIVTHFYWDRRERKFYEIFSDEFCRCETIFEILDRRGMSGGVYGAYFRRGARDTFKKRILRRTAGFVSKNMGFLMNFLVKHPSLYRTLRRRVVGHFEEFIDDFRKHKHSFYYVMFNDVDKAGHKYGPESSEYRRTIGVIDEKIGFFLDELRRDPGRKVVVVVAADHGQKTLSKKISLEALELAEAGYNISDVREASAAYLVKYSSYSGGNAYAAIVSRHIQIWLENPDDAHRLARVLGSRKEFEDIRLKENLGRYKLINDRTGDIVFSLSNGFGFDFLPIGERGDHGGLTEEEMVVPLILWGKGIPEGNIPVCRTIDITPTILKLLGVNDSSTQGKHLV